MSTKFYIHCWDCDENHPYLDPNWKHREVIQLCDEADAVSQIAHLMERLWEIDIDLSFGNERVNLRWFCDHQGHRIGPLTEYGATPDSEDWPTDIKPSKAAWGPDREEG